MADSTFRIEPKAASALYFFEETDTNEKINVVLNGLTTNASLVNEFPLVEFALRRQVEQGVDIILNALVPGQYEIAGRTLARFRA